MKGESGTKGTQDLCNVHRKEGLLGMNSTENYARYTKSGTVPDVPTKKYFTHIYIHLSVY